MKDDRDFFDRLAPPLPPLELRARVLAAAGPAVSREPRGFWTRVWESRPLRISWAASVAVLLLAHLALSLRIPKPQAAVSASSGRPGESDFARAISLPRIDPVALEWTALEDEESIDRADRFRRATPPAPRKEKAS